MLDGTRFFAWYDGRIQSSGYWSRLISMQSKKKIGVETTFLGAQTCDEQMKNKLYVWIVYTYTQKLVLFSGQEPGSFSMGYIKVGNKTKKRTSCSVQKVFAVRSTWIFEGACGGARLWMIHKESMVGGLVGLNHCTTAAINVHVALTSQQGLYNWDVEYFADLALCSSTYRSKRDVQCMRWS